MASISLDRKIRWWSVRYLAAPGRRVKKTLCRHEGPIPKAGKKGTTVPAEVRRLAEPYLRIERGVRTGAVVTRERAPLDAYIQSYLDEYDKSAAPGTAEMVRRELTHFAAFCKGKKVDSVQGVTPNVCREWLLARGEGIARSTLKTRRAQVRPAFQRAKRDGLVLADPWEYVTVAGKDRVEEPTYWTEVEVKLLLDAIPAGWLKDFVVVALNTGIRASALLGLTWQDVDWPGRKVKVRAVASKSGRRYEVPMSDAAHDALARRLAAGQGDFVFGGPKPGRPYSRNGSYDRLRRIVRRVGIPDHGDYNHVLRRSFATIALDKGVPLATVSRWLGHASIVTTQRYLGHRIDDSRRHMDGFSVGG